MKIHKWHTILNSFANLNVFIHEKVFPLYSKILCTVLHIDLATHAGSLLKMQDPNPGPLSGMLSSVIESPS